MGRKPLSELPKTNRPLRVLLTDSERNELDAAAEVAGVPTSTWARDLLLDAARGIAKDRPSVSKKPAKPVKKTS